MARRSRRAAITRRLHELLDQYEPRVQQAFLESAARIRSDVLLREFVDFIARGDIEAAIRSLSIDPEAFQPLDRVLTEAYGAGGNFTADNLPAIRDRSGARIVIRFDQRNIQAETWARNHVGGLIRGIVADQVEGVRAAITSGLARGQSPLNTALDVVGRINPASGRREGGIIGLTSRQSGTVDWVRDALASGDVEGMKKYLGLARRDKRFDRAVARAIGSGEALDKSMVERVSGRLSDRYLALRGEVIARTETLRSVNAARHEAFRQGLEKTGYTDADVERIWDSAGDGKVRHSHAVMDGQTVTGMDKPFQSPSGALLKYPGDPDAPADETIQCRCIERLRINFFGGGSANG